MIGQEIYISTVFIAGVLSFFAPCIVPLLPVYLAHLSGNKNSKAVIRVKSYELNLVTVGKTFLFVAGLSTSFIILGFGAGALGVFIGSRLFLIILGIIVILLGIHQTGLVRLNILERQKKIEFDTHGKSGWLSSFLLGFTFSFGWTPCIGPVLGAVLGISASNGQVVYGGWLMFVYSIGLAIPFIIIALFSDLLLLKVKKLNKHLYKFRIIGGIIIILMGILLMTDQMNNLTIFFENLF